METSDTAVGQGSVPADTLSCIHCKKHVAPNEKTKHDREHHSNTPFCYKDDIGETS